LRTYVFIAVIARRPAHNAIGVLGQSKM